MSDRGLWLILAITSHLGLFAQHVPADPPVFDGFPVPARTKELLFYIQRNKNANTIIYEARSNAHGVLDAKEPVSVFWIRYTDGDKREPLNALENKLAYGVRHKTTKGGTAWMEFVASKEHPFRVEITPSGQAEARMLINGRYARLDHVEVQAKEHGFWPKILHVDLFGSEIATGRAISQRLHP